MNTSDDSPNAAAPQPAPASPPADVPSASPAATPVPNKPTHRGLFEDLLVTGFGMATSAAVAYGSFYATKEFEFAPYTWMVNMIIPAGAFICGSVAAVGYWAGSRVFHHRPTRLLLLNIVLVALGTFFSIHHLDYTHARAGARSLESVMSFPDYLVSVTEHMAYRSSRTSEEPTELGKWGWGVAALQVGGFCLGGFFVYGMLVAVPYCDRCSRYFGKVWSRSIRWNDLPAMDQAYAPVAELLNAGQLQVAIKQFDRLSDQGFFKAAGILTMDLRKCPVCENRRLKLSALKRNGNQYAKMGEVVVLTEEAIHPPAA